jgi:flagellar M-ring protein FliF
LVSSSVESLTKKNITVADTAGHLLYQPSADGSVEGLSNAQLKHKTELENKYQRRIEQMLGPVIGLDRVIAKVNAELDFSQKNIHKVTYDPDSAVVRSEQKSSETSRGSANLNQGVPEPNYQGAETTGSGTTQESTRTRSTTNFEINKEEQDIVVPMGQLDRLSVAVIVDGTYETQDGEKVFVPRKEEELNRIQNLVKSAVGFDRARGDVVEVSSIAFGPPEKIPEPTMMETALDYAQRFWKPLLNALIILLFLLLVVRPLVLALIRPKVSEEEAEETEGLPEGEPRMALTEGETEEDIEAIEAKRHFDELKARAIELMEQNTDQAITVVRQWLKEESA